MSLIGADVTMHALIQRSKMKKQDIIRIWLEQTYDWPNKEELDGTIRILSSLEPETERMLSYFQETGIVLPLDGDYPTVEQIRAAHPNITDVALISIYDSLLKFDLKRPKQ